MGQIVSSQQLCWNFNLWYLQIWPHLKKKKSPSNQVKMRPNCWITGPMAAVLVMKRFIGMEIALEDGGRWWYSAATSQGMPRISRKYQKAGEFRKHSSLKPWMEHGGLTSLALPLSFLNWEGIDPVVFNCLVCVILSLRAGKLAWMEACHLLRLFLRVSTSLLSPDVTC